MFKIIRKYPAIPEIIRKWPKISKNKMFFLCSIRGFYLYWFIAAPALFSLCFSLFYSWFLSVLYYRWTCLIFAVFFFILFEVFVGICLSLRLPYFCRVFLVLFVVFICIGLSLRLPYFRLVFLCFIRGFYLYYIIDAPALFSPCFSLFYSRFLSVLVYRCACLIFAVFFFILFVVFICIVFYFYCIASVT